MQIDFNEILRQLMLLLCSFPNVFLIQITVNNLRGWKGIEMYMNEACWVSYDENYFYCSALNFIFFFKFFF